MGRGDDGEDQMEEVDDEKGRGGQLELNSNSIFFFLGSFRPNTSPYLDDKNRKRGRKRKNRRTKTERRGSGERGGGRKGEGERGKGEEG